MIDRIEIPEGIERPTCCQCGDPMTLVSLESKYEFEETFHQALFECNKIPIRIGHLFSMWKPMECVRCGQNFAGGPCPADKSDHDHVMTSVDSHGNKSVVISWD